MKKSIGIILTSLFVMMFAGCGGALPEMSDAEMNAISEYAAITMLKYDANSKSRLVDLSQVPEPTVPAPQPEQAQEQPPEPETSSQESEPLVVDHTANGDGNVTADSLEDFLELPDNVKLTYSGYELTQSYQQTGDLYFALEASAGKQLLVLQFEMQNQSGEAQNIRLIDQNNGYRVTVNGDYTRAALTTMLDNDLSTFIGTVSQGESRQLVLLFEVDPEKTGQIDSLQINFKNNQTTYIQNLE